MLKNIGFFHFEVNHNNPIRSLEAALDDTKKREEISDSLIVLPEGFNICKFYKAPGTCNYDPGITEELKNLSKRCHISFVAGLIIRQTDGPNPPYNGAYLIDGSDCEWMSYKLGNDETENYTVYPSNRPNFKVITNRDFCMGALLCMDALEYWKGVVDIIDKKVCGNKIICIPACASYTYFSNGECGKILDGEQWRNKRVILANSDFNRSNQCNSFITNKEAVIIESFPGDEDRNQNKIVLRQL